MMKTRYKTVLPALITALFFLSACDQQATNSDNINRPRVTFEPNIHNKQFGKYLVHINALTTDQLPTEVARAYKISRSKNRAMLNVSIREKSAAGETPITADISVIAKNLNNQLKNTKLREIKETDPVAIYYIGELPVGNEETIVFDLDVTPSGSSQPLFLSYRQQFFTE